MGVEIPSGFGQLTWFGFHGSTAQLWACTMGIDVTTGSDADDVAAAGFIAWRDNILPLQSSSTGLTSCRCKFGPSSTGAQADSGSLEAGGVDSPTLPSNVAVLVRKNTALGGRAGRGRMFIVGMPEGSVGNGGVIDSGVLASWQSGLDDFQSDLQASLFIDSLVLLHDESSPVGTPTVITTLDVQALVATQRRRLRR